MSIQFSNKMQKNWLVPLEHYSNRNTYKANHRFTIPSMGMPYSIQYITHSRKQHDITSWKVEEYPVISTQFNGDKRKISNSSSNSDRQPTNENDPYPICICIHAFGFYYRTNLFFTLTVSFYFLFYFLAVWLLIWM